MDEKTREDLKIQKPSDNLDKYDWSLDIFIDSVKIEEKMEKNAAQKRLEARFAAKKKLRDEDIKFMKKFAEKRKQQAVKGLASLASSLTGANNLHKPIIMEDKA